MTKIIRLNGTERVRVAPGQSPARLIDLDWFDVLAAANLIRDSEPALCAALMQWQCRLRRALVAPRTDGPHGGRAA